MSNIITLFGANGQPVNANETHTAAAPVSPIDATSAHESVSGRYQFISTRQLIDAAESRGFEMRTSSIARSRAYAGHQKHVVRLAPPEAFRVGEEFPELVVQNAHAGASSLRLYVGVYRLVCANGLVVGSTFDEVRFRHTGESVHGRVAAALDQFIDNVALLRERIALMKSTALTPEQIEEFMIEAARLRFGADAKRLQDPEKARDTFAALGVVRRPEDTSTNAWSVLNSVQENIIRGTRGIRRVTSPVRDVELNRQLWDLAERTLIKAA